MENFTRQKISCHTLLPEAHELMEVISNSTSYLVEQTNCFMQLERSEHETRRLFAIYAKNAPLTEGKIVFDNQKRPKQVIYGQSGNKIIEGIELNESKEVSVPLMGEYREGDGWEEHDDDRLESMKKYIFFARKKFPDGHEETTQTLETELRPKKYRAISHKYVCKGDPKILNGRPCMQDFIIRTTYKRGDESEYIVDSKKIFLSLENSHKEFKHNNDYSYQIINCFGSDEENKDECPHGPQNYPLMQIRFNHKEVLEQGNDDNHRILKTYFEPKDCVTPEKVHSEETVINRIRCRRTDWRMVDAELKGFKIFTIDGINKTINSNEADDYNLLKTELKAQGDPVVQNGFPVRQFCSINLEYQRPNFTVYYKTLPPIDMLPLLFIHLGFDHDHPRGPSRQWVKIESMYEGKKYVLYDRYLVEKQYPHLTRNHQWEDNKEEHFSIQKAQIYIDASNALDCGRINATETIVENERILQHQDHRNTAIISNLLPGYNWVIRHSGETYR